MRGFRLYLSWRNSRIQARRPVSQRAARRARCAFNSSLILFETLARARGLQRMGKNNCAQPLVSTQSRFVSSLLSTLNSQLSTVLLSYSYTALEPFRHAKSQGWKTVLVQIDPGPEEERIVAEEVARVPELAGDWQPAPAEYWDHGGRSASLPTELWSIPNGRETV